MSELPPILSEPQSKEPRPSAATMRRASGFAGRPRGAKPEATKPPGEEAKGRQFRTSFASGMATRGRADSPTKLGVSSEHLQGLAGAE